jgi:hypothetical protein
MQPRTGLPWVKVEEISVVVTDYQPMSPYLIFTPHSAESANLYFVEIDHEVLSIVVDGDFLRRRVP